MIVAKVFADNLDNHVPTPALSGSGLELYSSWVSSQPATCGKHPISKVKLKHNVDDNKLEGY